MYGSMRVKAAIASLVLVVQTLAFAAPALADADTVNPVIVDILPATGTVLGKGSVTFTIRAYDEHPGQLTLTFGDEDAVNLSTPPIDTGDSSIQTNMDATLTIDTNNFPDGRYILHVKATDETGNSTERAARYTIDKEAPSVPTGGAPNGAVRHAGTVNFDWDESSDVTSPDGIRYELRASQNANEVGAAPDTSEALYRTGISESAYAMDGLGAGFWLWQVRAVDAAGNKSAWSDVWHVTLDDVAPVLEVTAPIEGVLLGGNMDMLTIESSASDANGLKAYGILLDGVEVQRVSQPQSGVMSPIAISMDGVEDGQHTLTVFAIDEADIRSEVVRSFVLDTAAPLITTPLGDEQVIGGVMRFTMTSTDVYPFSNSMRVTSMDDSTIAEVIPIVAPSGVMYYDWNTMDVEDGTYMVHFRSVDAAGNEAELVRSVRVKNEVATGMGTVLPTIPLVETLDVELSQPRLLGIVTPPIGNEIPQQTPSAIPVQMIDAPNPSGVIPIQSTENGWRLFGVLWYWWALSASALGAAGWWGWRFVQRRAQEIG